MECSKIVDINTYVSINNTRAFFLDTNVLYWYTYPRFNSQLELPQNAKIYYRFVDNLVAAGNPLYTSIYNLTELLNVIEKMSIIYILKYIPNFLIQRKIIEE